MSKKYRFGIIGCGVIAHYHIQSILAAKNAEAFAVCDIFEEKVVNFANEYNVEKYYTDYKQLLEDENIDIVCICTPSGMHGEMVINAAKAKKHILCEKPIEIKKEKIDEMITAVKENGVKMSCVFQKRTSPEYIAVKQAVEEGKFGKVVIANGHMRYFRTQEYYNSAGWRGTWELDGGGALMNQGIHGIDILLWTAGDVESVFARAAAQARNIEVEDTAVAVLKFKNGSFGIIEGTTLSNPAQGNTFEIHGDNGSVFFGDNGITLWKVEGNEEEQAPKIEIEKHNAGNDAKNLPKTSHLALVNDLMDAIENDRETLIPIEEGRKAVDLILAIYESAKTGKEVKLN